MKNLLKFIVSQWRTALDQTQKPSIRFGAALSLLALFLAIIALLVALAYFVNTVLPTILVGLAIIWFAFGDAISNAIDRHRLRQAQAAECAVQQAEYIWRRIADLIIPAIEQVAAIDLEPEEIIYNSPLRPYGAGFYFALPRSLDDSERLKLRRLVELKLYGRIGKTRSQIRQESIVLVGPDYLFIRNDPAVLQCFSSIQ